MTATRFDIKSNLTLKVINRIGWYFRLAGRFNDWSQGRCLTDDELNDPIFKNKLMLALNILYVTMFNVDDNNAGNKNKILQYIAKVKIENINIDGSYSSFLGIELERINKLIIKFMKDNPEANFITSPDMLSHPEVAQPIAMLCHYFTTRRQWWSKASTFKNDNVFQSLKILMSSKDVGLTYQLLESILEKDKLFESKKWLADEEYLSLEDTFHFRGNLATILKPYILTRNAFFSAGAGGSSKDLAALVLEYYKNTLSTAPDEVADSMSLKS